MWPRLCGMGLLNVHPAELQAVATRSHGWSVDVAVTAMPAAPEASIQATAAAVAAVHVSTGSTGGALSTRMSANGGQLSITARELAAHDQRGAEDLHGVQQGVSVVA